MSFFERQLLRTSNSLYIAHSDLNFQRLSLYQKITILLRTIVPYTLITIRNGVIKKCIPFFTNFIRGTQREYSSKPLNMALLNVF